MNQEIDALKTLGISPMEFLVLPRMLALILMMPLLCIFADLIAIGDQLGWRSLSSAARPATWGLDIEVPLYRLKSRPALPGGATAARMS